MSPDDSDTESFKSAEDGPDAGTVPSPPDPHEPQSKAESQTSLAADETTNPRFTPEEEATLVTQSNEQKTLANSFFAKSDFSTAIQTYEKSLSSCPNYLDFEVAVLKSNIAACYIKLREWKDAVDSATAAVDALERLDPSSVGAAAAQGNDSKTDKQAPVAAVEEVDDETADKIEALARSGRSRDEVMRIRVKALLRRAKGREELGGWANLQGAEEDYKHLATLPVLSSLDRQTVDRSLRALPPRLEAAKQKEMGEMMGKLKDLGNGILKPFGLSTDNFQFVKDEKTGGYSMNFNQGAGGLKIKTPDPSEKMAKSKLETRESVV